MSSIPCAAPLLVGLLFAVDGCSATSSSGTGADASTPGPDAAAPSDAGLPVNGCAEGDFAASDHTAASDPRVIQGPPGATPQQYVPSCMRIKAGQTVTFVGDNAHHPIDTAEVSGGTPFPIVTGSQAADGGASFTVTVAEPGVVRFNCDVHPVDMKGAIEIVP